MSKRIYNIIAIGVLIFAGLCNICYSKSATAVSAEAEVSIKIGKKVGETELRPVSGVFSSASFYVPVNIFARNVGTYYVSVFYDCSESEFAEACANGNLLTSSGDTIPSVDGAKTFGTMQNEWGFRYGYGDAVEDLSNKSFASLPTKRENGWIDVNGEQENRTQTTDGKDEKVLTLGFGTKVDTATAAGEYGGKVTVAVVATPRDLVTWDDIGTTTMQNMTAAKCDRISFGEEGALQDTRDNKIYKVAKLKDGNCWMIQNLALEGGTEIDSSKSNLGAGMTYTLPEDTTTWDTDWEQQHMHNGTHVDNKYDNNPVNTAGSSDGTGDNTGAYYKPIVAIAGNPENLEKESRANYDICPKNWKLPVNSLDGNTWGLLNAYNITANTYNDEANALAAAFHIGYGGYMAGRTSGDTIYEELRESGQKTYYVTSEYRGWDSHTRLSSTWREQNGGASMSISGTNAWLGSSVRCLVRR